MLKFRPRDLAGVRFVLEELQAGLVGRGRHPSRGRACNGSNGWDSRQGVKEEAGAVPIDASGRMLGAPKTHTWIHICIGTLEKAEMRAHTDTPSDIQAHNRNRTLPDTRRQSKGIHEGGAQGGNGGGSHDILTAVMALPVHALCYHGQPAKLEDCCPGRVGAADEPPAHVHAESPVQPRDAMPGVCQ